MIVHRHQCLPGIKARNPTSDAPSSTRALADQGNRSHTFVDSYEFEQIYQRHTYSQIPRILRFPLCPSCSMKFGIKIRVGFSATLEYLPRSLTYSQDSLYKEWSPFYLDYNQLKRVLKVRPHQFGYDWANFLPFGYTHQPHSRPVQPERAGLHRMNRNFATCLKRS